MTVCFLLEDASYTSKRVIICSDGCKGKSQTKAEEGEEAAGGGEEYTQIDDREGGRR